MKIAPLRLCIAAALAVVLLATMFRAGQRGLAEVVAQESRFEFQRWQAGKTRPDAAAAGAITARLRQALALDPDNPNLLADLGRIESWRVREGPLYDDGVRTARGTALENFRRAARMRPTSGHSWANVAVAKVGLGSLDAEYRAALQQTLRWAPWDAKVQLVGIELGLASWQFLSEEMRQDITRSLGRQAAWPLVEQKPALIRLLRHYRRTELGCPWGGAALGCPSGS